MSGTDAEYHELRLLFVVVGSTSFAFLIGIVIGTLEISMPLTDGRITLFKLVIVTSSGVALLTTIGSILILISRHVRSRDTIQRPDESTEDHLTIEINDPTVVIEFPSSTRGEKMDRRTVDDD